MKEGETTRAADFLAWSPLPLRRPSASGEKDDLKFAFFADKRRLLIEQAGLLRLYDSAEHQISAVTRFSAHSEALVFLSQQGERSIAELKQLS